MLNIFSYVFYPLLWELVYENYHFKMNQKCQ